MINGLWKGSLLVLIISLYWKKRSLREHTKNPNAYIRARPVVTFCAVGYHPPPASFSHVLCKIWEHAYVQKD